MCGIYGYVGTDAALGDEAALASALRALRHRGPDGQGTFQARYDDLVCGLSHTRLAILDLSPAGRQPMATEDGRFVAVYNGEVYNFAELRRDLEAQGDRFSSNCDTEVVLKAYVRWGKACLDRFRGMFALAIWDTKTRRLFLARDPLGIKPLYYVERGGGVAFASEVRTLLATGAAPRRLSRPALASYFAFGAVAGPEAIIDEVRSLPPGHTLEFEGGKVTIAPYWQFTLDRGPLTSFDAARRELGPILRDAVRLRLIADVPLGIFLSGGIDSSALVALATEDGKRVHTFTVTFDEASHNEAAFAAEVARRFGSFHQQVHLPAREAAIEIDEAVRALDQPSSDGVNTYFVSKAARSAGLTVALSGLGGDEMFAGYRYFRDFGRALAVARVGELLPATLRARASALGGVPWLPNQARKLASLLAASRRPEAVYASLRAMFTEPMRRDLFSEELAPYAPYNGVTMPSGLTERLERGDIDPVSAYSALEIANYLEDTLLRDADVMSMAHGLELRVPLLDHLLTERVMRVPGSLKLNQEGNKPLLCALVPALPRTVTHRRKMGFTLPFDAWFRGPLRSWLTDTLLGEPVRRLGFLRPQAVERLLMAFLRGERYVSHSRVWTIAALARWCHTNEIYD